MPMLPEEKARVKIDKQLRNAGWDIVTRNEYLPNSIDGTAIRIQFKISGLSKIKDILTEINEEGKHDRNDGFKTASKASQFDFLDYEKAEENRIVREAREEAERKRVEEARRREENRQRKEQEIRLVKELVNKAEDYRIAKEIREYIQAMIDSGNEDITPAWIEWARKKADWYDPSIATEDEYLGKRQHEKNAEEKEKSLQDSIRKSWYW